VDGGGFFSFFGIKDFGERAPTGMAKNELLIYPWMGAGFSHFLVSKIWVNPPLQGWQNRDYRILEISPK
jgi:hypothetical protein